MFKISPHVRQYLFSGRDSADAHFQGGLRPQRAGSIALMILLLAILGAMGYRATVRSISLRLMEEHNVALAQAVTRGLSTELSMLMNPNRATASDTGQATAALLTAHESRMHKALHDEHVHYFDIHALSGEVIYTSHPDNVGSSHEGDTAFISARAGMIVSRLERQPADMIDPTQPHMHLVTFAPIHGPDHNAPLGVLGLYGVMEPGILPYPFIQFLIGAIFGLPPAAVFIYGCVRLYRRRQGNLHSGHESLQLHDADAVRCHTITAQETERKRISQDLHDGICQYLNAIKLRLQNISTGLAANHAADACTEIEEVVQVVTSASDEVRRISLALRPAMLDDLGLIATLNWLCREFSSTHPDIALIKDVNIQEQDIPDRLKTTIFRISQEALTNVAKHSHATHVHIALEVETGDKGSSLSLTVTDNGRGFDPSAERCHIRSDGGLGMHSMRERAQLDGGMLQIHSAQDTGTRIRARWPIQQAITHPDLSQNP